MVTEEMARKLFAEYVNGSLKDDSVTKMTLNTEKRHIELLITGKTITQVFDLFVRLKGWLKKENYPFREFFHDEDDLQYGGFKLYSAMAGRFLIKY